MVKDHYGKCGLCGEEKRWAYSGHYRASYCDKDRKTTLEKWNENKNIWVREEMKEGNFVQS